jgi:hypothetical protein
MHRAAVVKRAVLDILLQKNNGQLSESAFFIFPPFMRVSSALRLLSQPSDSIFVRMRVGSLLLGS